MSGLRPLAARLNFRPISHSGMMPTCEGGADSLLPVDDGYACDRARARSGSA